jgi:hypothetical protein
LFESAGDPSFLLSAEHRVVAVEAAAHLSDSPSPHGLSVRY